jgi:hypothetical protein
LFFWQIIACLLIGNPGRGCAECALAVVDALGFPCRGLVSAGLCFAAVEWAVWISRIHPNEICNAIPCGAEGIVLLQDGCTAERWRHGETIERFINLAFKKVEQVLKSAIRCVP